MEIVKALRRRFGKPILLIPHVTSPHSNDHAFLMSVARSFDGKQDVFCLPANLTAPETKWIISQLCCLIASRTHAAIAGFSSGIPTVSLAYSRKAYGINDSLFGNADYVIAPGDLTPAQVVERTCLALEQTGSIKRCLQVFMRTVYQQTMFAGQALRKLLTKRQ